MSYIPRRDSFTLTEDEQSAIFEVAERIDAEARTELHKDSCGCDGGADGCRYGTNPFYEAPTEFVVAWLLREGAITTDQVRALAALDKKA